MRPVLWGKKCLGDMTSGQEAGASDERVTQESGRYLIDGGSNLRFLSRRIP